MVGARTLPIRYIRSHQAEQHSNYYVSLIPISIDKLMIKYAHEDDCETIATQSDPSFLSNFVTKDGLIEFKQFAHSEILSTKADVANRRPSPSGKPSVTDIMRYL